MHVYCRAPYRGCRASPRTTHARKHTHRARTHAHTPCACTQGTHAPGYTATWTRTGAQESISMSRRAQHVCNPKALGREGATSLGRLCRFFPFFPYAPCTLHTRAHTEPHRTRTRTHANACKHTHRATEPAHTMPLSLTHTVHFPPLTQTHAHMHTHTRARTPHHHTNKHTYA